MTRNSWFSTHILFASAIISMFVLHTNADKEGFTNDWQTDVDENKKVLSPLLTTLAAPEAPKYLPLTSDSNSEFKVVCYFGTSERDLSKINIDLCSHIVYIYVAVLDEEKLLIKPREISSDFKERIAVLKGKGIKVLVAIGGWDDSMGNKYSRLVASSSARANFVADVVGFLDDSGFDGLELQWQYPSCWGDDDCSDKRGFTDLVKELHQAFKPKSLLLSAYVAPLQHEIDSGYDVPAISEYLDWIAVMCHSYHGYWNGITGHVAPMYGQPHDYDRRHNTNFSINYWIEKGADRKKILMTMPLFGRTYSLSNSKNHGLGVSSNGAGEGNGIISYRTVCQNVINKGYKVVYDEEYRVGPYAYLDNQWVSFDDAVMLKYKSEYIKEMGLGGAMVWSLDFDDYDGVCGCESYPLIKAVNRVLRNYAEPDPKCYLDIANNIVDDN